MLNLDNCRRVLGEMCPDRDEEVEAMRDWVYAIAQAVVDSCDDRSDTWDNADKQ